MVYLNQNFRQYSQRKSLPQWRCW